MPEQNAHVLGITRQSLEATVIHACHYCGAPGLYKSDERTQMSWPGCYKPEAFNLPVGDVCPNCGHRRRRDKGLGEVSSTMPRWLWRLILAYKWCLIKLKGAKHGWRNPSG